MTAVLGIAVGLLLVATGLGVCNAVREPLSQPERMLLAALTCAALGLTIAAVVSR